VAISPETPDVRLEVQGRAKKAAGFDHSGPTRIFHPKGGCIMAEEKKEKLCLICGKPSESSICEHCQHVIQGEALEKKQQVEKKGKADTGRQ
jgi:hypothetical protein